MLQKHIWTLLLFVWALTGCSEDKEEYYITEEVTPSAFESALDESKELLLLVKNNLLVMDSTNIEASVVAHNLKPEGNNFRSETNFGNISLKRVFKCSNGLINAVHFDFYYDSLNTELDQDSETILNLIQKELGDYTSTNSSSSMKIFTWKLSNNVLDYELFKNGFTFTIRKNKTNTQPVIIEKELSEPLKLAGALIDYINNNSIGFESTMPEVESLFGVSFKGKSNTLAFSETYNENILLSGSFLFDSEIITAIYFDYVYSDTTSKAFISDAKLIKSKVTELYNTPSEVATVPLSTLYKWSNTPIVLEVYSDGFSIIFEKPSL